MEPTYEVNEVVKVKKGCSITGVKFKETSPKDTIECDLTGDGKDVTARITFVSPRSSIAGGQVEEAPRHYRLQAIHKDTYKVLVKSDRRPVRIKHTDLILIQPNPRGVGALLPIGYRAKLAKAYIYKNKGGNFPIPANSEVEVDCEATTSTGSTHSELQPANAFYYVAVHEPITKHYLWKSSHITSQNFEKMPVGRK